MDLRVFYSAARSVFEKREQRLAQSGDSLTTERFIRLSGLYTIRIQFLGEELEKCFMPALEHIEVEATDHPHLTIKVWDSPDGKEKAPYPSFKSTHFYQQVYILADDEVRVYAEMGPSRLTALDIANNEALYWVSDTATFPWFEKCRPFRTILHWWGTQKQMHMLHAGAVGTSNGGALLVGPAGAGKSTTSLACLGSELKFISDDHCMLGFEGSSPYAYSVFDSAKLNMANNINRLPRLKHCIVNADRLETEKAMMHLKPHYPEFLIDRFPVKAMMIPVVTGKDFTRVVPTNWNETARALIPSTMSELPGAEIQNFFGMFTAIKTLPCYRLELGTNMDEIAGVISGTLKELALAEIASHKCSLSLSGAGKSN